MAQRDPKWSQLDPKWYPNGTPKHPYGHRVDHGPKMDLKMPRFAALGPSWPSNVSMRIHPPPCFPSTSCPHRFPLGAAVSRSAYNAFGRHFGTHFLSYFCYFSEPLKTWNLQYISTCLKVLAIPKALILGPLFDHLFDPILGPPFGEPFGPPWPPKVPTLPPHVGFDPFLGPPLGPKWDLGAPMGGQGGQKGW